MILFVSDGRLGNQLFQLAFLQTLVEKNERVICFNMHALVQTFDIPNKNFRFYSFSKIGFAIYRRITKPLIISLLTNLKVIGYCYQVKRNNQSFPEKRVVKGLLPITIVETHFFQSEEFFDVSKISFSIKESLLSQAKGIFDSFIIEYEKVFVHIRRGDYISESYNGVTGIELPFSYYEEAIQKVKRKIKNPFFIFLTDEPEFVEENFAYIENKYCSKNEMGVDLALMSLCDYGIISNSSFSWWGSYLMKNKKIVIAPKYWYGWKSKKESHISIQPQYSIQLEIN